MSSSCASCRSLQTVRVQIRECDVGDVVKRGALKEEPRTDANVKMTARGGSIWWRGVDVKEGDKLSSLGTSKRRRRPDSEHDRTRGGGVWGGSRLHPLMCRHGEI